MAASPDEAIVARVQEGNLESFGTLVERYEAKLLRYARKFLLARADAEDLVQEVFLKAYANIRGFDPRRRFSPWIYRIAHNIFLNAIEAKRRAPFSFFDPDTLLPHPIAPETADRAAELHELCEALRTCLDRLHPKYREPIVLYYVEELGYRDIAEVLRIPIATVGIRLRRGKILLRKLYEESPLHHE